MATPGLPEQIDEVFQDMIQSLMADQETGSHHFNNAAAEEFARKYPRFMRDMGRLGALIDQLTANE